MLEPADRDRLKLKSGVMWGLACLMAGTLGLLSTACINPFPQMSCAAPPDCCEEGNTSEDNCYVFSDCGGGSVCILSGKARNHCDCGESFDTEPTTCAPEPFRSTTCLAGGWYNSSLPATSAVNSHHLSYLMTEETLEGIGLRDSVGNGFISVIDVIPYYGRRIVEKLVGMGLPSYIADEAELEISLLENIDPPQRMSWMIGNLDSLGHLSHPLVDYATKLEELWTLPPAGARTQAKLLASRSDKPAVVAAILAAALHSSCRTSTDEYAASTVIPNHELGQTGPGLWSPVAYEAIVSAAWLAAEVAGEAETIEAAGHVGLGWCVFRASRCSVGPKSIVKAVKLHKPGANKLVWKGDLQLPVDSDFDPRENSVRVDLHGADGYGVFEAELPTNDYDKVLGYGWKKSRSGSYLFKSKFGTEGVKKLVLKPKGEGNWKYSLVSSDVDLNVTANSLPLGGRLGLKREAEHCSYTEFLTGDETRPRCVFKPGKLARCR